MSMIWHMARGVRRIILAETKVTKKTVELVLRRRISAGTGETCLPEGDSAAGLYA
jgi:hypothetical protein